MLSRTCMAYLVSSVRTMNYGGGKASVKYTNKGIVEQRNARYKKAVVTVADGETIDLFTNYLIN